METLLSIAIALCAGLLVSRFVKPLKLPAVTGYLIAGVLIGPYCLGKLGVQGLGFPTNGDVKALSLFNDVALGFIAFAIGNEFRLSQLRHTGKQATVIGIFQALMATLMIWCSSGCISSCSAIRCPWQTRLCWARLRRRPLRRRR